MNICLKVFFKFERTIKNRGSFHASVHATLRKKNLILKKGIHILIFFFGGGGLGEKVVCCFFYV